MLREVAGSQDALGGVVEQQESEFEEAAQKDRITRLTSRLSQRDQQKIREIDSALERMAKGVYGKSANCGRDIDIQRLSALPSATPKGGQQALKSRRSSCPSATPTELGRAIRSRQRKTVMVAIQPRRR